MFIKNEFTIERGQTNSLQKEIVVFMLLKIKITAQHVFKGRKEVEIKLKESSHL